MSGKDATGSVVVEDEWETGAWGPDGVSLSMGLILAQGMGLLWSIFYSTTTPLPISPFLLLLFLLLLFLNHPLLDLLRLAVSWSLPAASLPLPPSPLFLPSTLCLVSISFSRKSFARAVSVLAFLSSPGTISPAHSQTRIPHHTTRTLFLIMSISANLNSL